MQANITGFTISPAIPNHSISTPTPLYKWSILVSVKQEKLYQGVSKKATEMIYMLVHSAILLFLLILLTLLLILAYFWVSK
jgi:hypothetical protein